MYSYQIIMGQAMEQASASLSSRAFVEMAVVFAFVMGWLLHKVLCTPGGGSESHSTQTPSNDKQHLSDAEKFLSFGNFVKYKELCEKEPGRDFGVLLTEFLKQEVVAGDTRYEALKKEVQKEVSFSFGCLLGISCSGITN